MSNTAIGTNAGYPRFGFAFPSMVAGRIYTVSGTLTGDITGLQAGSPIRLSTAGANNYITYEPSTGKFFGTVAAAATVGIEIILDGTKLSSVSISGISIKETSLRNRLYTNINSSFSQGVKRTTSDALAVLSTNNTMSVGTTYLFSSWSSPNSQKLSIYFAGELDNIGTGYQGFGNTDNTASYEVVIGSIGSLYNSPGCEMLQGDLAELVIYNKKLSDDEMTSLTKYFANKWGLTSMGVMCGPTMGSFMGGTPDASVWYTNQYRLSLDYNSVTTNTLTGGILAGNSQASQSSRSVNNGGHFVVSRSGDSDIRSYDDGTQIGFSSTVPTSGYFQTSVPIFVFAFSNFLSSLQGGPPNTFIGYGGGYSIGNYLSPTEVSTFSRIMNKFQASLGRT
jgi:hypothetical protein